MKMKFFSVANKFRQQGYNASVSEKDGIIHLGIWCRNHKPGDNATDVSYNTKTKEWSVENNLQLELGL